MEILHDFKSHQPKIRGVAQDDGQAQVRAVLQLDALRHIDGSRQVAAHAHPFHERQLFHLVFKKLHLVVVHRMVVDVVAVVHGRMCGPLQHVLHLDFHHQRQRDQKHGQHILDNDEYLAEQHLVLAPQCPLDHVDGLVAAGRQGRRQAAERSQHQNAQYVSGDVSGREQEADGRTRIHLAADNPVVFLGQ